RRGQRRDKLGVNMSASADYQSVSRKGRTPTGGWLSAALAVFALIASSSHAFALMIPIQATLTGAGEVPANNSPGRGLMVGTFDTDTNTLTWTVTYSGLSSPVIAAHFHGPVSYLGLTPEENAPIQVAISPARSTVSPSSAPTRQRTSRTGAGT